MSAHQSLRRITDTRSPLLARRRAIEQHAKLDDRGRLLRVRHQAHDPGEHVQCPLAPCEKEQPLHVDSIRLEHSNNELDDTSLCGRMGLEEADDDLLDCERWVELSEILAARERSQKAP